MLWDCVTLLDDATASEIEELGGMQAIAISHPHYYATMVEWAHRFACRSTSTRPTASGCCAPDPCSRFWSGETARSTTG